MATLSADNRLRWGIIATGHIARRFATGLAQSRTGKLVAVASRRRDSADRFAADFAGIRAHASYQDLLDDQEVQAVYIATPHPQHCEWTIKAANAGKHILCEKPLAMNAAEARRMIDAARARNVFLMEAFMYRCHPQTKRLVETLRAGAIGRVQRIESSFHLQREFDPMHRLFNRELGGGGILDIGCYPVSYARLIAGAAAASAHASARLVSGSGKIHPVAKTDHHADAVFEFDQGISAHVSCGTTERNEAFLRVHGSSGWIDVPSPFQPGFNGRPDWFLLQRTGQEVEKITCASGSSLMTLEADEVGQCFAKGTLESAAMSHTDSLENMLALDAWRKTVGVRYAGE